MLPNNAATPGTDKLSSKTLLIGNDSITVAANAIIIKTPTEVENSKFWYPSTEKYHSRHRAMLRPNTNMAEVPAQDFSGFQGNGFVWPKRRPMMSARPSPPHIKEVTTKPTGEPLQYIAVTESSTIT